MEAYGAKVILTPAEKTIEHSRELAEKMAKEEGYHILNQIRQSGQLPDALPYHRP